MRKFVNPWCFTLLAISLSITSICSAEKLPGEYLHEIKVGYETPHIKWAKPYARGKLKVFFLTPFTGAAREAAELWQRMDIQVFGETTMESSTLGREDGCFPDIQETSNKEKAERLRKKLERRYDVFVCANFLFSALPTELQYRILEQVAQGAGLVFVYPHNARKEIFAKPTEDNKEDITTGIPFAGLPFFTNTFSRNLKLTSIGEVRHRVVNTYTLGKGRIAEVNYSISHTIRPCGGGPGLTPFEPFNFETPTYYEYYHSLIIRTLLWAAGKLPQVKFVSLPEDGLIVEYDKLQKQKFTVRLRSDLSETLPVEIWLKARDIWGEVELSQRIKLSLQPGNNSFSFSLPALKGGGHFVDFVLRSVRGKESWASFFLQVKSPVEIIKVELEKPSFRTSEPAAGKVTFEPAVPSTGRYQLQIQLLDNYGRLFAQRDYRLETGMKDIQFQMPLDGAVSLASRVRARIIREKSVLHQTEQEFVVVKPKIHDYPALIWGRMPGILGHLAQQRLREAGFCAVLDGTDSETARQLARDDLMLVPYCTRITGGFTDPEYRDRVSKAVTEIARALKDYHPLVYSLGDENYIPSDFGFRPEDKSAFIDFLRKKYGALEALNAAWGTQLKSWNEAEPVQLGLAKDKKQYVQYHDTESFREESYAEMHHFLAEAIRKKDSEARVGAEGSEPGDLEKTISRLEFWGPYRDLYGNTLLRSLAPRQLVRGNWFGGYRWGRRDTLSWPNFLWEALMDGNNLIEYFAVNTVEGIFNSDFSWAYWTHWFWEDFQQILNGLGQLINVSDYDYDGVALHHSQACWHASALESRLTNISAATNGFLWLLTDLGIQHFYLPRSKIEAGELRKGNIKLLILPYSQAISEKEAQEIKAFVRNGGVLMADMRPAIMDGNCELLESGRLDDLFGIRRRVSPTPPATEPVDVTISGDYKLGSRKISIPALQIRQIVIDSEVSLANGQALGTAKGVPVFILQGYGRGLGILLNFDLGRYLQVRDSESRLSFQKLLRAVLLAAGVSPEAEVLDSKGNLIPECRVVRFRRGAAKILGVLLRKGPEAKKYISATLRLNCPVWVYDIRGGRKLGKRSSIPLRLQPARANFYSLLPYSLKGLRLSVSPEAQTGKPLAIEMNLIVPRGAQTSGHLLRLNVFGPEGKERKFYAQTLYVTETRCRVSVPFAFNDPAGQWRIQVRDVLTGTEARAKVQLLRNIRRPSR